MSPTKQKNYRPSVGLVIINDKRQIFVGERIDNPGAWQMPQGGVEKNESIETTTYREMLEETGTNKAEILAIAPHTICYDFPTGLGRKLWNGQYHGQEQRWVLCRFTGTDKDINLNHHTPAEFKNWKWVNPKDLTKACISFKEETYKKVLSLFENYLS